jgi:hypothetical protein
MPIRIEWKNGSPVAECDTVEEAVEMMRAASAKNGTSSPPHGAGNGSERAHRSARPPAQPDIVAFLREQKPQIRQLLESLYSVGEDIKAEDLASRSSIDYKTYGGLFGALSKYAKRANIPLDNIYTTSVRFDGPRRERWYTPGKSLMELGAQAFGAK